MNRFISQSWTLTSSFSFFGCRHYLSTLRTHLKDPIDEDGSGGPKWRRPSIRTRNYPSKLLIAIQINFSSLMCTKAMKMSTTDEEYNDSFSNITALYFTVECCLITYDGTCTQELLLARDHDAI